MTDSFAPTPAPSAAVPPAWYPDPGVPGQLRWFDGSAWTAHVHAGSAPAAPNVLPWGAGPPAPERNRTVEALIPINRSGTAIAAGYAGLFSILIIFAPIALALGVMALLDLRNKPTVGGRGRAWFGVITGALGTIVLIALLLA